MSELKVNDLIQVECVDLGQVRGGDSGNEVLQILASTLESKIGESRKGPRGSPCYGRQVYAIRAVGNQLKSNMKSAEPGKSGQPATIASGEM